MSEFDRDTLILEHMYLAEAIANKEWRTATHALKRDVMVSLAYLGLVEAAQRWQSYCAEKEYDPKALQYFKVFASLRIRGAIRDHIRKEDWATRTLRSKSKVLKEAGQDEGLSVSELSHKTGMPVPEINKVIAKLAARPVSLDKRTANEHSDNSEIQLREDRDTEGIAFANAMNSSFLKCFHELPDDWKVVLAMHYYSRMDLRTISGTLGLSEPKVSQIHSQAILQVLKDLTISASESEINA